MAFKFYVIIISIAGLAVNDTPEPTFPTWLLH
ncbi:MAG: hypothetical protein ACI9BC_002434 [Crocinitomicaceae bacterium]|jgi:hypothetical protein